MKQFTNAHDHTAKYLGNTAIFFLLVAPAVVLLYASFIFNPNHIGHPLLYGIQIVADSIGMFAVFGLWLTILMDVIVPEHHRISTVPKVAPKDIPQADILITVAGEPLKIIAMTALAAKQVDHVANVLILDDGKSDKVKMLAEKIGCYYVRREHNHHAKAGNINHGLGHSQADFFAILDADQQPLPNFISKLMPYFHDDQVAMVQSPQHYTNSHNFIASGTAQAQDIFYNYVCSAKNTSNSAFCVGTNVIFRRSAIDQIGGIAQLTHSEDIWTSLKLHEHQWKTIFIGDVLVKGLAPETIIPYFKQQTRWAAGGFSMLFTHNPLTSSKLSLDQKIQYFLSNTFYFVGFTMLTYIVMPIIYLLFDIRPFESNNVVTWITSYLPYVAFYYSLTWMLLGKIKLSSIAVSLATFYPYMKALINTLFSRVQQWQATTTTSHSDAIMTWIWPHVLLMMLSVSSLIIGWIDVTDTAATLLYSAMVLWNLYLLTSFVTNNKASYA